MSDHPMQSLSVLIPAYNCNCLSLVEQLHSQLEQADIPYEIIVGDDGSTDPSAIQANRPINALSHCRYIVRTENTGRASIRNFLAQTAQYEFLLLIDSDMSVVSETFIQNYLNADCQTVVDGGITVSGSPDELQGNLRYLYEQAEAPRHTAAERQCSPHQHIHTRRSTSIMCLSSISTTLWEWAPSRPMPPLWRRRKKDCGHSTPSATNCEATRDCSPSSQASISPS